MWRGVAGCFPGCHSLAQVRMVGDTPTEAVPPQEAQLDRGHVQQAAGGMGLGRGGEGMDPLYADRWPVSGGLSPSDCR